MENTIFITCYFGTDIQIVNNPPFSNSCYFFTNNKKYKNIILKKGWAFIYVNKPITSDILTCSLQSKYIKFLSFLNDFSYFKRFEKIIYFDHKEIFDVKSFNELNPTIINNLDKSIIIRKSEIPFANIQNEIYRSSNQAKYNKNLNKTISYLNKHKTKPLHQYNIYNTGLIIYLNIPKIIPLLNIVYQFCIIHLQPQCQIYWSFFSEKYIKDIFSIEYKYLKNLKRNKIEDKTLFIPSKNIKLLI